jgi:peptidoglycan/xylan/chitin deacetylase (PgdA/CDA1 family)
MKKLISITFFFIGIYINILASQFTNDTKDSIAIIKNSIDYKQLKSNIISKFNNQKPRHFGEFIKGSYIKLKTDKKIIAFTFDACGGRGSNGYNAPLIDYLRKEKIPATLFITGKWIDANLPIFKQLASDTLFEIENHGLNHRLCSVNGASVYGIQGTKNISEVVDEMELNAIKIEKITGRRPIYFRSATAFTDDVCTEIAEQLKMKIVSYSTLSGDAIVDTPDSVICNNILKRIKPGAIVIMHFNHALWQEKKALQKAIPILRKMGYSFVKLKDFELVDSVE